MPTSEFEFTQAIKHRLLALNEIYQGIPFPGFGDIPARRTCEERLRLIQQVVPNGGRVIDVGSNLGYYCFRLAQTRNATCHGIECVPETYQIAQDLAQFYAVPGVTFQKAWITPELLLEQPYSDVILFMAVLHHVLRDNGRERVEAILRAARERGREIIIEFPALEETGWKAGKAVGIPDPMLLWLRDLGLYPVVAQHVRSHVGTNRPFIYARPYIVKQGDARFAAELEASKLAEGVVGIPQLYSAVEANLELWYRYVPGQTLAAAQENPFQQRGGVYTWSALARTIASLHSRGVVHGDVRAWNVILGPDRAYLTDLGLAVTDRFGPTDYQLSAYAGLAEPADWDWLGLAAMKWFVDREQPQPQHPHAWLPHEVEQNKRACIEEAKAWATK